MTEQEKSAGEDARIAEIRQRVECSTDVDLPDVKRTSYDHGGGRMFVTGDAKRQRQLVLDVYEEHDRTFYFRARLDMLVVLDALAAAEAQLHAKDEEIARLQAERDEAVAARDALAAWQCQSCGARFVIACRPELLDGVTRCTRCVELEVERTARKQAEGDRTKALEALKKLAEKWRAESAAHHSDPAANAISACAEDLEDWLQKRTEQA